MYKTIISTSTKQTKSLAADLLTKYPQNRIFALFGDLGSGKTTFTQGLAKALGIKNNVISPTFIIMRSYKLINPEKLSNISYFYHIDLYRIKNSNDLQELGLFELLKDPQNIFVIEWPEKIASLLPKNSISINFDYLNKNERKITIKKN